MLKKPSRDDFDKKMRELDNQINAKRQIVEENKNKKRGIFESGKAIGGNNNRESISSHGAEIKEIQKEKNKLLDELNGIKEKQQGLEAKKRELMKNIPRNYNNAKELESAIKEKQRKYETESNTPSQEKELLKVIDQLKKALPDMEKLSKIDPDLNHIREKRKEI